jgi:hypothetical protein
MAAHPLNQPQEVRSNDHLQNARRDHGCRRACNGRRGRRHRERIRSSLHYDEHDRRGACHAGRHDAEHVEHVRLLDHPDTGPETGDAERQTLPEHGLGLEWWLQLGLQLRGPARGNNRAVIQAGETGQDPSVGGVFIDPAHALE